jgi:hypothetical protein
MAISGTYTFNPDITEIVEEAYERAGLELRSGYDLKTARRSLNLLTLEWQNRGLNLWTIDESKVGETSAGAALTTNYLKKGTASYNLDVATTGLLDIVLRTDDTDTTLQSDYHMSRISQPTYAAIPNKLSEGRPLQYYLQRKEILDAGDAGVDQKSVITLWPVPDEDSKYKLVYWRVKRIADAGDDSSNTVQVPDRFMPALISGLAYHIAMKRPEVSDRAMMLKQVYEEQFQLAAEEDRVKTSARFVPYIPGS